MQCASKMATCSVARMDTNSMRGIEALGQVLWRSATSLRFSAALGIARTSSALHSLARKFQAHRLHFALPGTAYPVTIATLCSATSSRFSAALGIARTSSALRSLARKFQARFLTLPFCARISTNSMRGREGRAFCKTPLPLRKILPLKTIHTRHWRGYELIYKWLFVTGWGDEPSTGDGLTRHGQRVDIG